MRSCCLCATRGRLDQPDHRCVHFRDPAHRDPRLPGDGVDRSAVDGRRPSARFLPAQRNADRDFPDRRGRVLGADPDCVSAALYGRLFLPSQAAADQARRPRGYLHARELPLFPVRLDAQHRPLEQHPSQRILDHYLRLDADHDSQFRDLLSPRLFHGAGSEAADRGETDGAAGDPLLDQRNPARLRLPHPARHWRPHQQCRDRRGPDQRADRFHRPRCRALCRAHLCLSADHDVPALQCDRKPRPQPDRGGARSRRAMVAHSFVRRDALRQARHRLGRYAGVHALRRRARRPAGARRPENAVVHADRLRPFLPGVQLAAGLGLCDHPAADLHRLRLADDAPVQGQPFGDHEMSARLVWKIMLGFYIAVFFAFLFGPLVIMSVTAFNISSYPQVWPFEGFTLDWFLKLVADRNLMEGLVNSFIIGALVVALAVPVGLAGAIVMTQIYSPARSLYYLIVVSPVLTPGVIIGISTVIFWKDVTELTGAQSLFNGIFLATLGQATFISAYCMLIFLSRLQRYDRVQEEAALDLGASQTQVFFDILLPFLRPAIFSAAVIAFLSSFENYNTTTFAILANKTLTTVLAGRVRQGMTPAISALAVLIIAITVTGAIVYEIVKSAEMRREARLRVAVT